MQICALKSGVGWFQKLSKWSPSCQTELELIVGLLPWPVYQSSLSSASSLPHPLRWLSSDSQSRRAPGWAAGAALVVAVSPAGGAGRALGQRGRAPTSWWHPPGVESPRRSPALPAGSWWSSQPGTTRTSPLWWKGLAVGRMERERERWVYNHLN